MHLKNFSLYSLHKGYYTLTPAYDMVSTKLVMPEDTKELALTLNDKKCKIKRSDSKTTIIIGGLDDKIIHNLFTKATDKWLELIEISFLPDEMKEQYKQIIQNKLEVLKE